MQIPACQRQVFKPANLFETPFRRGVRILGLALLIFGATLAPAEAAINVYLSISGIPGESTAAGHAGWTDVLGWGHGISTVPPNHPNHSTVNFTKFVDLGSPLLNSNLCKGTQLPFARIDFVTSSPSNFQFFNLTLSNVIVSSMSESGDGSSRPTESVSLFYTRIAWTYTTVDNAGNPSRTNYATWDLLSNSGTYTSGPYAVDSDGDGIPDWWMNQYFGHPTGQAADNSLANQDADGDGLLNYQEYIAGTNPTNANSVFRVSRINLGSGQVRVTWTSVAGKTYTLYGAPDVSGPYSAITTVPSAGDGETFYDLADSQSRQFFRVSVP